MTEEKNLHDFLPNKKTNYFKKFEFKNEASLIKKEEIIDINNDTICLRPYVKGSISPFDLSKINKKKAKKNIDKGQALKWNMIKI